MWFTEWYNNSIIAVSLIFIRHARLWRRIINFRIRLSQNLVYAENSTALKYFIKPPLDPLLRVHIFNYTNADRFLNGTDDKLTVEDIGPFTYTEKVEKVNVVYNDNDTISYRVSLLTWNPCWIPSTNWFSHTSMQEHRSFIFQPNLSEGKQYAQVTVPNIPMLTAASKMKYASFLQNIGINFALSKTNSHPFKVNSHFCN